MAVLHRYSVRVQSLWTIPNMAAVNEAQAKALSEQQVIELEDADIAQAISATLVAENTGDENGVPLNTYETKVRARRNILIDAEDAPAARGYAIADMEAYEGMALIQVQSAQLIQENTGVSV